MKNLKNLFKVTIIVMIFGYMLVGFVSCGEEGGTFEITNYSLIEINININHVDHESWVFAKYIKHGETVKIHAFKDGKYEIRVFPRDWGSGNVRVTPESASVARGDTVKVSIFNQ